MKTDTPAAAKDKLSNQSLENLQEMAVQLMSDHRDEATAALDWVLDELELRLTEKDFVIFCDSL